MMLTFVLKCWINSQMNKLRYLFPLFVLMLLSGCGFHLQNKANIPSQFKTMELQSSDPYGRLSRSITTQLIQNDIQLVQNGEDSKYPSLRILGNTLNQDTISIYPDGKSAEYQLTLTVESQVVIAGKDIYPITVKVFRTFFDNPATALAKSTEQTLIENEMYQQAATQLINKLRTVNTD